MLALLTRFMIWLGLKKPKGPGPSPTSGGPGNTPPSPK